MKPFVFPILFVAAATPALAADEALLRFDDANTYFPPALGKQVNVRFDQAFATTHFGKTDFDALVVSELPDGKVCFFGRDKAADPADPKLEGIARPDYRDECFDRSLVAARYVPQEAEGAPRVPFYATGKKECEWSWKTGGGIGVWTENCKFETGNWRVDYDEAHDYFSLRVDESEPFPVLRLFRKKPEEGLDTLLTGFRAKGLIPGDEECRFQPAANDQKIPGWSFWEIMPVGKRKEAFDALPKDEVPEPPCGDIGYAVDYVGFFMIPDGHPDRVLYVNLGQDGTMFDPFTISIF